MQNIARRWIVALAAIAVNLNVLGNGFVYDDGAQVLNNPYLHGPQYLGAIFTTNVWGFMGPTGLSNYYRPLIHALNMVLYVMFGPDAFVFHLVSVLAHAGCAVLVFEVGATLGFAGALPAALIFAVHPIHTEAVAWIAAAADPLCSFLVLLSFLLVLKGRPYWAAAVFFPALLLKEAAVALLPLLWISRRKVFPAHLFALGAYLVLRVHALGGLVMTANQHGFQILSSVYLAGKYLGKLFFPYPFNIFYVFHPVLSPDDLRFAAGLLALGAGAAYAVHSKQRESGLWFAAVWILLPLMPVLYTSRLGENVFCERYLYLPSVGFCWIAGAALANRRAVIALLLIAGACLTVYRNNEWHDDIRLYEATLAVSPESAVIRGYLGTAYLSRGMPERALPLFQSYNPATAESQLNAGLALSAQGRHVEARSAFERATALQPQWGAAWHALANAFEDEGDRASAELIYRRAIGLDPKFDDAHEDLGLLLFKLGRLDEAKEQFQAAGSHLGLGLLTHGADAEREFRAAVAADANNAAAWIQLARLQKGSEAAHSLSEARRVWLWSRLPRDKRTFPPI